MLSPKWMPKKQALIWELTQKTGGNTSRVRVPPGRQVSMGEVPGPLGSSSDSYLAYLPPGHRSGRAWVGPGPGLPSGVEGWVALPVGPASWVIKHWSPWVLSLAMGLGLLGRATSSSAGWQCQDLGHRAHVL